MIERRRHDDAGDGVGDAVAADVPVEPDEAATMTAIALAESGGGTRHGGEDARGLWQIDVQGQGAGDPGAGLDGLAAAPEPPASELAPARFGDGDGTTPGPAHAVVDGRDAPAAQPEVDDEVLVAFVSGDVALADPPPALVVDDLPLPPAPEPVDVDDVGGDRGDGFDDLDD